MVHKALQGCNIVALGVNQYKDWQVQKVKDWVEAASGKICFQSRLADDTSHLVLSEKQWRDQGAIVQDALKRNEQHQVIHIVKYDWLDESLQAKSKRRESTFSWVKNKLGAQRIGIAKEPRSTAGLMSEAFTEATKGFVTEAEMKRFEKKRQLEDEIREAEEERKKSAFKKLREQTQYKQLAETISRGVKKARNELLGNSYHIYVDGMGCTYNVAIRPRANIKDPGDRFTIALQIWESNSEPHTFAFNAKFSGTQNLQEKNKINCIGCNFKTAFRCLKKAFKVTTLIDWNVRGTAKPRKEAIFEMVPMVEVQKKNKNVEGSEQASGPDDQDETGFRDQVNGQHHAIAQEDVDGHRGIDDHKEGNNENEITGNAAHSQGEIHNENEVTGDHLGDGLTTPQSYDNFEDVFRDQESDIGQGLENSTDMLLPNSYRVQSMSALGKHKEVDEMTTDRPSKQRRV